MTTIPNDLSEILEARILSLTCFPVQLQLLEELSDLLSRDERDPHRLTSIVKRDIGLSARLYKHALEQGATPLNHFQLVSFVKDDLPRIVADKQIKLLAIDTPMLGFSLASMSARALKAAILSQNVAEKELQDSAPHAYFAGYLHEIGLYALCAASLNNKKPDSDRRAIFSNEQALRAGTLLLKSWKAAPLLVEAIACQLDPQSMSDSELSLAAILNLATSVVAAEDSPEALQSLLKVVLFEKIGRKDLVESTKLWVYSTFKQGI